MRILIYTFATLFFLFLISGCNNFKRFEQKKYFCSPNKLNIELIDILETRSIKKAYLTIKGKEYQVKINSLSDSKINLQYNEFDISISFIDNQISVTTDNEVLFLNCEESNFNI
tara:strand:- start:196 stop:537 length:342 start_codon:yes stop_codon:yes gene_type:complete